MYSRKLALTQARQYRTCPPPDIAKDPLHDKFFRQHLSICPYCNSKENEGLKTWADLSEALKNYYPAARSVSAKTGVAPGQLRFLKSELGTWHQGRYYNPPCVLVLEKFNVISDDLQAAQIYHDIALAASGDLIVEEKHTGIGDLFIECWNTYTLKSDYLGPIIGEISFEIVEAVKKMEEEPEVMPEWTILPRPLTEEDPRLYFRELEVEVGYFFASRAAEELVAKLEVSALKLVYSSPREIIAAIKDKSPGVYWAEVPATIEGVLATAQFPPEEYAMAAADDRRRKIPMNLVSVRHGRIKSFKPLEGEILQTENTAEGLAVGGHVAELPEGLYGSILLCFLESEKEGLLVPLSSKWDEDKRFFLIKLDSRQAETGQLRLALVFQLSSG